MKEKVQSAEIDEILYRNNGLDVYFQTFGFHWSIFKDDVCASSGNWLYPLNNILDHPIFKILHIKEVRIFNSEKIPAIQLVPGIKIRTHSILEMLNELISSNFKRKENTILSL